MNVKDSLPQIVVTTPQGCNGHTPTVIRNRDGQLVHEDSPLMAALISADSARRAVDRSKYTIRAVK